MTVPGAQSEGGRGSVLRAQASGPSGPSVQRRWELKQGHGGGMGKGGRKSCGGGWGVGKRDPYL